MQPDPQSFAVLGDFLAKPPLRYLLGATPYAAGIIATMPVRGVIDDFSKATDFHGVPILRSIDAPKDALVVTTTLGRPHTARQHLLKAGLAQCDYFTFHRHCGLELPHARFWTGFGEDAREHAADLQWVRARLADEASREVFDSIVNLRLSANLDCITSFRENQANQYFEPFLELQPEGESFADIGCFDGRTSSDFIARCPQFNAVHIFEPDPKNLAVIRARYKGVGKIHFYPVGVGDANTTARFSSSGSTSVITDDGDLEIQVEMLDRFGIDGITFLKMDIEGAELRALAGARETIRRCHPRLAICVYHQASDLWRIPREVSAIRDDYRVHLRHYTEGVTETVMFFTPKK
jgi:FkbM family methyltransferase